MAYCKQLLALILVCLSVFYNYRIEGRSFVEIEGGKTRAKEGRSVKVDYSRITSNLFSSLMNGQSSDFHVHRAGFLSPSGVFHGTRARINVWGIPDVYPYSESSVFLAVLNENGSVHSMLAGFHVYPRLYAGNADLRLFAAWTTGYNDKACYSTKCGGFVLSHVDGAPVPGRKVEPLSTFNGEDHYITLSIKKDEKTQDWSLYRDDGNNPVLIGWWPKTLFNNTFDAATKIMWLGGVLYPKNEPSPPMGSGHIACEGENKAAYISHIKYFDRSGRTFNPLSAKELTDRNDCFTVDHYSFSFKDGFHFYYGGPAGCKN